MKGRLLLHASHKSGRTILKESYFTPPFKTADITENKNSDQLHIMIMSSSPGILDGDEYEIRIHLGEKAKLVLSTQSFQRLFQMKNGASQSTEIHLEACSSLRYLPHPCVPHEQSIFKATNLIRMEAGSSLLYGEVITCGRTLNGEKFLFSKYESLLSILYDDVLIVKENIRMIPLTGSLSGIGLLEDYTHQASLICLDDTLHIPSLTEHVNALLMEQKDIEFGISATQKNGIVLRLLGKAAYQLHDLLQHVAGLIKTG